MPQFPAPIKINMIKSIIDNETSPDSPLEKTDEKIDASDIFGIKTLNSVGEDGQPSELLVQTVEQPPPLTDYSPPSAGETVRMTGLAWSAGVSLFGSIVAMMLIGWLIDLLVGSSPWGLIGGIVFGAVIGFIQFFRINSEIFKKEKDKKAAEENSFLQ